MNLDSPIRLIDEQRIVSLRLFVFILLISLHATMSIAVTPQAEKGANSKPPIVLRDLTLIRNQSIVKFDDFGIQLSDGRVLTWDRVLKADVDDVLQASFDEKIRRLGLPLFRLKFRVQNRDWAGAGSLAESLYAKIEFDGLDLSRVSETISSSSGLPNEYLICFATMKSRLHQGDRPGAVLPFLRAAQIQSQWKRTWEKREPNFANLFQESQAVLLSDSSVNAMLSSEIIPAWFVPDKVEPAFDVFSKSFVATSATEKPGPIIYLASMAIELRRFKLARDLVQLLANRGGDVEAWRVILEAQIRIAEGQGESAVALLQRRKGELKGAPAVLAMYLLPSNVYLKTPAKEAELDFADLENIDFSTLIEKETEAVLQLLKIPALHGERYPVMSAAALFQASRIAEAMPWTDESRLLKQELLIRYPRSFHGRLIGRQHQLESQSSNSDAID